MKLTQTQRLLRHLRRRPHTSMELIMYGISVCPWARLRDGEASRHLKPGERIVRKVNGRGLVCWSVERSKA